MKYVCCARARDVGMIPKIIYDIQCEGCLNVGLCLYILSGHLFPPRYIKVHWIKESRCLSPRSDPQEISAVRLPTLPICHGFPYENIDTGVLLSLELCHNAVRGWLLRVLVAVGLSWLEGCYSCIL